MFRSLEEAFAGNQETIPAFEDWRARMTGDPSFEPAVWFLAEAGDGLAGVSLCWPEGFVKDLAVHPAWRRRGLGEALLRQALGELFHRGVRVVALKVDSGNPTGAIRLYERVGMRVDRRYRIYERRLSPDRPVTFGLEGLDHVALRVRDQARSVAWYRQVLGLERVYAEEWGGVPALLVAPGSWTGVALFEARDPAAGGVAADAIAMLHVAFRVSRAGLAAARSALDSRGIPYEFRDHEASHSLYFHDPDGHQVELTTYELTRARPSAS